MPAYIVKQPNGNYARFSTICDDFTHIEMTAEEVREYFCEAARERALQDAERCLQDADERGASGWKDANDTRRRVHGHDSNFQENVLDEVN